MMICLILLHDIVVADLDSHKCRVVNLDKQQPSLYLAIPQKMWFFCLISEVLSCLLQSPKTVNN